MLGLSHSGNPVEPMLKAYLADSPINRWEEGDTSFGVITAGTCYPYVREVLPDAVAVLKGVLLDPKRVPKSAPA